MEFSNGSSRHQLKREFDNIIKSCTLSQEKLAKIRSISGDLQNAQPFDTKFLDATLDLSFASINRHGICDLNQEDESTSCHDRLAPKVERTNFYDADDEGSNESYVLPCQLTFDDCHIEPLALYFGSNIKKFHLILKQPSLCEFIFKRIHETLQSHLPCRDTDEFDEMNPLDEYLKSICNIVKKLVKLCKSERKNCRLLSETNVLSLTINIINLLIQHYHHKQELYLETLLDLVFTIIDHKLDGHSLRQIFELIKQERIDLGVILAGLESLLDRHIRVLRNIQPLKSINFPLACRTADEIGRHVYVSDSWHGGIRSKVIDFKKRNSRSNNLSDSTGKPKSITSSSTESDSISKPFSKSSDGSTTPSWLECSLMLPLSHISPLIHQNRVKFACSMWISVCGDMFVIEDSKNPTSVDWTSGTGHWMKLASQRRSLRRKTCKNGVDSSKLRKIYDKEDEELEEKARSLQKATNGGACWSSQLQDSDNLEYLFSGLNQIHANNLKSQQPESDKQACRNGQENGTPTKSQVGGKKNTSFRQCYLMHLVSFAIDRLTIEIWLNVKDMTFQVRACGITLEGQSLEFEHVALPSHLEANGSWSNLVFSFEELCSPRSSARRTLYLNSTVNGVYHEERKLSYTSSENSYSNFAAMIGCERSTYGYIWKLSQIQIYKSHPCGEVVTYLLGKGPDFWASTDVNKQSSLLLQDLVQRSTKSLFNRKILDEYAHLNEAKVLQWLSQNIVMTYAAHRPENFLDYSLLSSVSPTDDLDYDASGRFIPAKVLNFTRSLRFNVNTSFGSALLQVGGIESVMVFFANTIRRSRDNPAVQSMALSIMFKMSQTNQHHLDKYLNELSGLRLAGFIMEHPSCSTTESMLNHYMDFCFVSEGDYCLIKSPKLVYHLINCWRAWHKDIRVAKRLYSTLIHLLQMNINQNDQTGLADACSRFNFHMMTQAGSIDLLISILKNCLVPLDDYAPNINNKIVELIVNLISLLIKHPPDCYVMYDLMEFLLFLHPDTKSYVDTVRSKVSFLHVIHDSDDSNGSDTSIIDTTSSSSERVNEDYYQSQSELHGTSNEIYDDDSTSRMTQNLESIINRINYRPEWNEEQNQIYSKITEQQYQKCSTRNFALASVADMLASIVKLTSTCNKEILSEAFLNSTIDSRKLIVLVNNSCLLVREKVLRLFLYCIRSCYSLNLKPILSQYEQDVKGSRYKICLPVQLMASQLLRYVTSMKMIQLCYSIIIGIKDLETVETVCLKFDIEIVGNNMKLNILLLFIQLMTQLENYKDQVSAIKFVYATIKQLMQSGSEEILFLLKNNLIESIMRIYFTNLQFDIRRTKSYNNVDFSGDKFEGQHEVRDELDKILDLIIHFYYRHLPTCDGLKSIDNLLIYFDLMNSYVPAKFCSILRDRKVKVLATSLIYCKRYENSARKKFYSGLMQYHFERWAKKASLAFRVNDEAQRSQTTLGDPQFRDLSLLLGSTYAGSPIEDCEFTDSKHIDEDLESCDITCSSDSEPSLDSSTEFSINETLSDFEIVERHKEILNMAVNFIITRPSDVIPNTMERQFIVICIKILSSLLNEHLSISHSGTTSQWHLIYLPKLEPTVRSNFARLILFLLSPCSAMNRCIRIYNAREILRLISVEDLIKYLNDNDSTKVNYKVLGSFIEDLIDDSAINSDDSESEREDSCSDKKELLKLSEIIASILEKSPSNGYNKQIWLDDLTRSRKEWDERVSQAPQVCSFGNPSEGSSENLELVVDEGLRITRDVVNDKNEQRKIHLEDMKQEKVLNYHIRQQWLSMILGQTHERAIWYISDYYPKSWELNPVEGPARIRRRLKPCKLKLNPRFLRTNQIKAQQVSSGTLPEELMSDHWYNQYSPHPLCSMVIDQEHSINASELRDRMFTTDKIHFNCDCSIIRPNEVCEGEISIASWCMHFIGERSDQVDLTNTSPAISSISDQLNSISVNGREEGSDSYVNRYLSMRRPRAAPVVEDLWFDEIVEILDRRYELQDVGLEIFLTNNMTYLLSFRSNRDREEFKSSLMQEQHKMINLQRLNLDNCLTRLTRYWREGKLTNYDYLTGLNKLAGRSFNDLMQYPIFPFVLSNYKRSILDLKDVANFRNLIRPMAIQNPEKKSTFIRNYKDSKSSNMSLGFTCVTKPYHYGNHYSNSATVLHFLVRLPPFTQMLIQYQDNNFDQPDRTFHSMNSTWQLITRDSNTDFKELIPEFFYLPEILTNSENLELGRKQNNEIVDDVKLPPWCPNEDARLFILIHRQALESDEVSQNLNHWVDLIFGYKQTGRAAYEATNVFHPATYYGMVSLNDESSSSPSSLNSTILSVSAKSSAYNSDSLHNGRDSEISQLERQDSGNSAQKKSNSSRQNRSDIERLALATMIKTYGQMPRQLFSQPSDQRHNMKDQFDELEQVEQTNVRKIEPLRDVLGLKWGSYVGSPDEGDIISIKHEFIGDNGFYSSKTNVQKKPSTGNQYYLSLLPNGDVAILNSNTSLVLDYCADRKSGGSHQFSLPANSRYLRRAGLSSVARVNLFSNMIISRQQFPYVEKSSKESGRLLESSSTLSSKSLLKVSWSHLDGTIRVRDFRRRSQRFSAPLVQADSTIDSMTTCVSVPELNLILVGFRSGAIGAFIISTTYMSNSIPYYPGSPSVMSISSGATTSALQHLGSSSSPSPSPQPSFQQVPTEVSPSSSSDRLINKVTRWLYCHQGQINCIKINVGFSIVATGGADGILVIWDLNSLSYVRTIDFRVRDKQNTFKSHSPPEYYCSCDWEGNFRFANNKRVSSTHDCICKFGLSLIAISDTLGDIASVKNISHNDEFESSGTMDDDRTSSIVHVHTINGSVVGCVQIHTKVTAICYSTAPEGISVNVIALGLANGTIRLYSSWDLKFIKEFHVHRLNSPITSLNYLSNNQLLYVIYADSQLVVLRNKTKTKSTKRLPSIRFL